MDTSFFALNVEGKTALDTLINDYFISGMSPLKSARWLCQWLWLHKDYLVVPCPDDMDWRDVNRRHEMVIAHHLNSQISDPDGVVMSQRIWAAKVMARTLWCLGCHREIVNHKSKL